VKPLARPSQKIIVASAAAVLAILVVGWLVWSTYSQPTILGAWRLAWNSSTPDGQQDPANTKYLGFVKEGSLQYVRTYRGDGTPNSLAEINQWGVSGDPPSLHFYFYDDMPGDKTSVDTYTVSFPDKNTMVLTRGTDEERYVRARSAGAEARINFASPESIQAVKEACAAMLEGEPFPPDGPSQQVILPITCTTRIGSDAGDVAFTFEPNATLTVKREGKTIFSATRSDTMWPEFVTYTGPFLNPNGFSLEDINYDGYEDIVLESGSGAYNFNYLYFLYDPKTHSFGDTPTLEATNPAVDKEARTITSFSKGRGLGDYYTEETYQLENGTYVLVERVTQDIENWDDPDSGYIRITEQRINKKLQEINREHLTNEEVLGWME